MHLDKIDCVGLIDARADKSWDGSGYCMNTDRKGDQWIGKWQTGSSTDGVASYEVIGVSGKYIGATGTGTSACTQLTSGEKGSLACELNGEIVLK